MSATRRRPARLYRVVLANVETGSQQSHWYSAKQKAISAFEQLSARARQHYALSVLLYGRAGTVIDQELACAPVAFVERFPG